MEINSSLLFQFGIFADLGSADECVDRIISGNGSSMNDGDRIFVLRQSDPIILDDKKKITSPFSSSEYNY